ncbi:MAG: Fe-S cluster assembly protein SufD [Verrucomicrobiota bacterium]
MSDAVVELNQVVEQRTGILEARPAGKEEAPMAEWFTKRQEAAWDRFESIPMPARRDEAWRFANLKNLNLDGYRHADHVAEENAADMIQRSDYLESISSRFVFANDRLISRDGPGHSDLVVLPLAEAVEFHPELVRAHFMAGEQELGGAKLAALHEAVVRAGVFVFVPKGVEVKAPIEVYHWTSGRDVAVFPHTLIVAEAHSAVTVIEHYLSDEIGQDASLSVGVGDLVVGEGAKVRYLIHQNLSYDSRHVQMNSTVVSRNGSALSFIANLGAGWVRNEGVSHLVGEGANSDMLSANVASGVEEYDQRTLQHHEAPRTTSDLLYKNALYDQARTIFAGLIQVDQEAHYTDAYQKCRNLLGSNEAEANSMPGLEINADQVKCSHGATAGQIDEEQLFYLLSRGVEPEQARKLITFGFIDEVIKRIGDEAIEAVIERMVADKFATLDV